MINKFMKNMLDAKIKAKKLVNESGLNKEYKSSSNK